MTDLTNWSENGPMIALHAIPGKYGTPPPEMVSKLPRTAKRPELDYVGHADTTKALIAEDPVWQYGFGWESTAGPIDPFAEGPQVLLGWIEVHGKRVQCIGTTDKDPGNPDRLKELIGDLIRNGAMRLGFFIDLWSKSEGVPVAASPPAPTAVAPRVGSHASGVNTAPPTTPAHQVTITEDPDRLEMVATLNGIADDTQRAEVKRRFVAEFGNAPALIPDELVDAACVWVLENT